MFELRNHANGDDWKNILVIYNPNRADIVCALPPGNWIIVATRDRVSESYLGQASREVIVPAISCVMLYQDGVSQ
jgi:pullulanase